MFEGMFDKVNRLQKSVDELTELVIRVGNAMQDNFEAIQKKYDSKMELIKEELKNEILKLNSHD